MNEFPDLGGRLLVIFDGRCGLCNRSVRWFLARDREDRLRFASSDHPAVRALLARHGFNASSQSGGFPRSISNAPESLGPESLLVVRQAGQSDERLDIRSDAVLILLRQLPRPYPALATALGVVPRPIRDFGYRLIARYRHRLWGRLATCPIPTADERARFL